jgi:hypothetical protein
MQPTPRKLTTLQKAVLIQVLRAFPDQEVGVCYHSSANDSPGYAQDFLTVFKAIGWTVNDAQASQAVNSQSPGLVLLVSGPGDLPPSGEALRDTLRIFAIEVATFCEPTCAAKPGGFILAVGPPTCPECSTLA